MRPSCSGMVLALTTVPGILESFLIIQLKTIFPISRFTRKLWGKNTTSGSRTAPDEGVGDGGRTHLMGTMWEKRSRKRKIWRYQRPAKCWRATMTRDTTTRAPNRIFVRQFTSRSNKPTCEERHPQT